MTFGGPDAEKPCTNMTVTFPASLWTLQIHTDGGSTGQANAVMLATGWTPERCLPPCRALNSPHIPVGWSYLTPPSVGLGVINLGTKDTGTKGSIWNSWRRPGCRVAPEQCRRNAAEVRRLRTHGRQGRSRSWRGLLPVTLATVTQTSHAQSSLNCRETNVLRPCRPVSGPSPLGRIHQKLSDCKRTDHQIRQFRCRGLFWMRLYSCDLEMPAFIQPASRSLCYV